MKRLKIMGLILSVMVGNAASCQAADWSERQRNYLQRKGARATLTKEDKGHLKNLKLVGNGTLKRAALAVELEANRKYQVALDKITADAAEEERKRLAALKITAAEAERKRIADLEAARVQREKDEAAALLQAQQAEVERQRQLKEVVFSFITKKPSTPNFTARKALKQMAAEEERQRLAILEAARLKADQDERDRLEKERLSVAAELEIERKRVAALEVERLQAVADGEAADKERQYLAALKAATDKATTDEAERKRVDAARLKAEQDEQDRLAALKTAADLARKVLIETTTTGAETKFAAVQTARLKAQKDAITTTVMAVFTALDDANGAIEGAIKTVAALQTEAHTQKDNTSDALATASLTRLHVLHAQIASYKRATNVIRFAAPSIQAAHFEKEAEEAAKATGKSV